MLTLLHIAVDTAYWLVMGCNLVGGVLQHLAVKGTRRHVIAKAMLYETLPFIVPVMVAQTWLQVAEEGVNLATGVNVLGVLMWTWLVKRDMDHNDDDRWTRRGRKIRQRLTIRRQAPVPSGA